MSILKYKYYDTPEGEDIFLKTVAASRHATVAGVMMATYDVLMFTRPKGILNTMGRYAFFVGPLVGMATAFTVTANVVQNYRGKNDKLNYFLGGAVSGAIFGSWMKKPVITVPAMVILGFAGMVKKTAKDAGVEFFPEVPQMTKTAASVRHDWTVSKDIDNLKTWSKS